VELTTTDLPRIDFQRSTLLITEKGGQQRRSQISKEGLRAIQDYIDRERGEDADCHPHSSALFLPAATSQKNTTGRLSAHLINYLWNAACQLAQVKHCTPHTRPGMAWVFISLRRSTTREPSTTMQYLRCTHEEIQETLDEQ
jgi:site-specific recombinase XerD